MVCDSWPRSLELHVQPRPGESRRGCRTGEMKVGSRLKGGAGRAKHKKCIIGQPPPRVAQHRPCFSQTLERSRAPAWLVWMTTETACLVCRTYIIIRGPLVHVQHLVVCQRPLCSSGVQLRFRFGLRTVLTRIVLAGLRTVLTRVVLAGQLLLWFFIPGFLPEGSLAGALVRHEMGLELVCEVDFSCKLSCRASPGDLKGPGPGLAEKLPKTDPTVSSQTAFVYIYTQCTDPALGSGEAAIQRAPGHPPTATLRPRRPKRAPPASLALALRPCRTKWAPPASTALALRPRRAKSAPQAQPLSTSGEAAIERASAMP